LAAAIAAAKGIAAHREARVGGKSLQTYHADISQSSGRTNIGATLATLHMRAADEDQEFTTLFGAHTRKDFGR
jgi:hypothetical protein